MSRPLRIEYAGALYHLTSWGINRREIFRDDQDQEHFVQLLSTKKPNLSRFMQRLNTAYTRYYNYKYLMLA